MLLQIVRPHVSNGGPQFDFGRCLQYVLENGRRPEDAKTRKKQTTPNRNVSTSLADGYTFSKATTTHEVELRSLLWEA